MCSLCCRLFELGPVEPEIVEGLRGLDIAGSWPPAADGWLLQTPRGAFFEKRHGSCVFLRQDGRCAIHALHGAAAKPAFCRTFPITLVDQPGGSAVAVREDCGGVWQSFEHGTPLEQSLAALPDAAPRLSFAPQAVGVLPGVGVSVQDWLALEDHLVGLIEPEADPRDNIATLRDALFQALRRTPPPPDAEVFQQVLTGITRGLHANVATRPVPEPASAFPARFLGRIRDGLTAALPRLGSPEALDDASRRYLALLLGQSLRGKAFQSHGHVTAALGAWLLGTELARARCASGRLPDLAPWHVYWSRFALNASVRAALRDNDNALVGLLLHVENPARRVPDVG